MNGLRNVWVRICGKANEFSDENRAFNAVAFFSFCALLYSTIVNFLIEETYLVGLDISTILLLSGFYFLSRFRKKFTAGRTIFAVFSQIFLVLNYFNNAGIDGPTLLFEFVVLFFLIVIFPFKQAIIWVFSTLLLPIIAMIVEYRYPSLIEGVYSSKFLRFLDIFIAYVLAVAFVVFCLLFLKSIYAKQRNALRIQADRLEFLNKENQKLFSIISHDLRSPLSTIEGYLKEMIQVNLDPEQRKHLEKELLDQTENTSGMLNNLLAWSKQKIDGEEFNPIQFKLFEVMSESLFVLEKMASRKGINFTQAISESIVLIGEPRQVEVLLRNLIQNAIKFTARGGEINIAAQTGEENVIVSIEDTGVGMKKEVLSGLFTEKVESTFGTNNEKGIGIGLNLCYEIVQLHQGEIRIESTLHVGTKFTVLLPKG